MSANLYESFPLGLRLGHAALLRNLARFARWSDETPAVPHGDLAGFLRLYVDFLDVHHQAEDAFFFPALRRHAAGRSTDAAHLERWTGEHRDVRALSEELARVAVRVGGGGAPALRELARVSASLEPLLAPHFASEEEILSPARLPELLPAAALADAQEAAARANRSRAVAMASFLVHSLAPEEQRALFGAQPWIFRKVILGVFGERKMKPYRPLVHSPTLAV